VGRGCRSCGEAATPDLLEQLVPRHHSRALLGEGVEEPELGRRETGTAAVQIGLDADGVEPQLLDLDLLAALGRLRANASPRGGRDAGDQFPHRERLDQVVVGAQPERVHSVVLAAARAHDDDRRADPRRARRLDQLPAVERGKHEVDDADFRLFVPEPREAGHAVGDPTRLESCLGEMSRHALGDHVVVFDDQDFRHSPMVIGGAWPRGAGMVKQR
jgi:hypothetical protein